MPDIVALNGGIGLCPFLLQNDCLDGYNNNHGNDDDSDCDDENRLVQSAGYSETDSGQSVITDNTFSRLGNPANRGIQKAHR